MAVTPTITDRSASNTVELPGFEAKAYANKTDMALVHYEGYRRPHVYLAAEPHRTESWQITAVFGRGDYEACALLIAIIEDSYTNGDNGMVSLDPGGVTETIQPGTRHVLISDFDVDPRGKGPSGIVTVSFTATEVQYD